MQRTQGKLGADDKSSVGRMTPSKVKTIVRLYYQGVSQEKLAARYNLTQSGISKLITRFHKRQNGKGSRPSRMSPHAKLKAHQVKDLRKMYKDGKTQTTLAKKYKVSQTTISNIIRRRIYESVQ